MYKMSHFQVNNLAAFSVSTILCNLYLVTKLFFKSPPERRCPTYQTVIPHFPSPFLSLATTNLFSVCTDLSNPDISDKWNPTICDFLSLIPFT